ncbi:MAG: DUF456 domain-containing protein [bacterium]
MEILAIVIALILGLVGLAGTLLPFMPGTPLILLGIFVHGFMTDFSKLDTTTYITLTVITIVVLILDFLASAMGAKKFGASWKGVLGAILGAIIGFIVGNVIGIIIGPFIGAVIGELAGGKKQDQALNAGLGAVVGFLAGTLMKFLVGIIMITIFIASLFIK